MRAFVSLLLASLLVSASPADPPWAEALAASLDEAIPRQLERGDIPGAVILVGHLEDGEWQTFARTYGDLQRLPEPRSMVEDAVFDLASMTKPIATGTSMMILVDRGLIDVDEAVATYLSDYDTDEKRDVKVRDLMTHCSGLPSYLGPASREQAISGQGYPAADPLQDYILHTALRHGPPRTVSVYSCLNAITCAEMVERVSGQPLDEFARENIFEPLGMHDTAFSPGPGPRVVPTTKTERDPDHFLVGMVHDPLANIQGGVSGNAGLFSTAQDISIFAQMMLQEGERDGVRILSEASVARMTSNQMPEGVTTTGGGEIHRGLLWQVSEPTPGDVGIETIPSYGHTGYTGTAIKLWPSENMYVIALTNRVHPDDTARVTGLRHAAWVTAGEAVLGVDESVMVLKDAGPMLRHAQSGG